MPMGVRMPWGFPGGCRMPVEEGQGYLWIWGRRADTREGCPWLGS